MEIELAALAIDKIAEPFFLGRTMSRIQTNFASR